MEIISLLTGLPLGFFLGYLYIKSITRQTITEQQYALLTDDLSKLALDKAMLLSQVSILKENATGLKIELEKERLLAGQLNGQLRISETQLKNTLEKLESQQYQIENLHKTLLEQFENISHKVLKNNSSDFNAASNEKLQTILNPLKDKIEKFEQKVQDTYEKSLKDNTSLHEQIKHLSDLNKQISEDATNLTHALRGEKKTQGNWGEMLLESLLEKSGLEKETQYVTQGNFASEEGGKLRPDVIINLPDNKHLIIDSKVSLVDYNDYCNSTDELLRLAKLKAHISCIRSHVNSLGNKRYDTLYGINSPDYVLMFIPIEPAFTIAMQTDNHLFLWALDKNIVLVTSSTLLATLRTVASIWKQENQKRNVLEIAEESGKLYDKFVGFMDDIKAIGGQIDKSKMSYDSAMNKLSTGSGNMMTRFEKLKRLGAKATKSIDPKLLDKDD